MINFIYKIWITSPRRLSALFVINEFDLKTSSLISTVGTNDFGNPVSTFQQVDYLFNDRINESASPFFGSGLTQKKRLKRMKSFAFKRHGESSCPQPSFIYVLRGNLWW